MKPQELRKYDVLYSDKTEYLIIGLTPRAILVKFQDNETRLTRKTWVPMYRIKNLQEVESTEDNLGKSYTCDGLIDKTK